MTEVRVESSTWKKAKTPRGSQIARHNKTAQKTTVSLYLNKNLVEQAKKRGLNLSKITEQALTSIIDYMQTQNTQTSSEFSLSTGSLFAKRESVVVPRAGFEPATTRSSAERSPRLSYLGGVFHLFKMEGGVLKFSDCFLVCCGFV